MEDHLGQDKHFAATLAKGLEILRCFTPESPVLANKDLVKLTGLPKSTISRFTYTLIQLGYLRPVPRSSQYQLGTAVLSLGYPLLSHMPLRQIARPGMQELADYAHGSVSMGMRDRLDIVYVETSRSRSVYSSRMADIGMSHPIMGTAIGRAYLCALTYQERIAVLNEIKVKAPAQWELYAEAVDISIQEFAHRRFCFSKGDLRPDIHAVAVPMRRSPHAEIVVFNCVVQAYQLHENQLIDDLGPRLAALVQSFELVPR